MPDHDGLRHARDIYQAFAAGEILTFRGDEVCRAEVYFGRNVS